jgi:dipeptidyl aminopeptidase/acylaminoacyl peptidase
VLDADGRAVVGVPPLTAASGGFDGLGERWARARRAASPSLAPDGLTVAYTGDESGIPALWLAPLGRAGTRVPGAEATMVPTGPEHVSAVAYAPDGRWIAVAAAPGGGEYTVVTLVRPDGGGRRHVAGGPAAAPGAGVAAGPGAAAGGRAATLGRWTSDGSALAVCESGPSGLTDAFLVEPESGGRTFVARGEALEFCDITPDGHTALLRCGTRGARRLLLVDIPTGRTRPLPLGPRAGAGSVAWGRMTADGHTVYVLTDAGRERAALVAVRFASGRRRVVTVEVLAARDDVDLERFALCPDGRTVALAWNVDGRSELDLLDLATHRRRPLPPLPGDVVTSMLFAPDGSWLLLALDAYDAPERLWSCDLADAAAGYRSLVAPEPVGDSPGPAARALVAVPDHAAPPDRAGFVGFGGPVPVAVRPVRPTLIRLRSDDGLPVTGWLYRPRGTQGPHPVLIYLHGGPEAQERPGYNPLLQALAAAGIAVFAPNVRGSCGFGRSFVEADDLARRVGAIADVAACVRHLVATGVADPDRVGCAGRSYGGYLTLAALVEFPELFRVGVDVCGMADLETFYARTEPWIAAAAVTKYGHPVRDRMLLRSLSPIHRFDRLAAPLLVVHGANDTNVPLFEAEQTVAAARAAGVPTRLLLFDDEGHEVHDVDNRAVFVREVLDWVGSQLLPAAHSQAV